MNLQTRIRQLADQHRDIGRVMMNAGELDIAIHHRQFSSELLSLIVDRREATMPTWIECRHCGRINTYCRNYCACGHQVEWL